MADSQWKRVDDGYYAHPRYGGVSCVAGGWAAHVELHHDAADLHAAIRCGLFPTADTAQRYVEQMVFAHRMILADIAAYAVEAKPDHA